MHNVIKTNLNFKLDNIPKELEITIDSKMIT